MYITHTGRPENPNASMTPQADTPAGINRASDIHFFNTQMGQGEPSGKSIAAATASPMSSWDATDSDALSRRVSKGFRDASQNKKTKDANEFPQTLAEAHIDVMSRVKVIGAVAKGVDKISSMG